MTAEPAELCRCLTHGVYVVGVSAEGRDNAFTAAWVMQASFRPLLLALSISPEHRSHAMLLRSRAFSVNVLAADRLDLAEHFGRPGMDDRLAGMKVQRAYTGAPILADALAWFDCEFSHECQAGDHALVIGRVADGAVVEPGAAPMNYRAAGDMDGSRKLYPDKL
jgi:flavin reductase (DIM6/NTAB) family NADH-FMN oxidoreductase RutF